MLVLARRPGEAVMIGDGITVTVLSVEGRGKKAVVRLGIDAPRGLPVARRELYLKVQEENLLAGQESAPPELQEPRPPSDEGG